MLLVRHGRTPTTGKVLPGRAPGLHLADTGRQQAQRAAERIAELPNVDCHLRLAARTCPRDRRTDRRRQRAEGEGRQGSARVRLRRRGPAPTLKSLMKLPEWGSGAKSAEHLHLPRRRELHRHADPHRRAPSTDCAPPTPASVIVCVSHADPIKAAVAHALGTHIDLFQRIVISTCSVSVIAYGAGAPIVLTVNSTGGSLAELGRLQAPMSVFFDFDEVDAFTVGAIGRARLAHLLRPGPAGHHLGHGEVREAAGGSDLRPTCVACSATCRHRPETHSRLRWSWPPRSTPCSYSGRSASATTAPTTRCWCSWRK